MKDHADIRALLQAKMAEADQVLRDRMRENLGTALFAGYDDSPGYTSQPIGGIDRSKKAFCWVSDIQGNRMTVSYGGQPTYDPSTGIRLEPTVGPQPEREIPVTEEMIAAANAVWNAAVDGEPLSMDIYRAMAALAPLRCIDEAMELADDELRCRIAALEAELAGKDARIAELKSELAAIQIVTSKPTASQTTPGDIQPTAAPKTFPAGALKPSQSDPRRVGG